MQIRRVWLGLTSTLWLMLGTSHCGPADPAVQGPERPVQPRLGGTWRYASCTPVDSSDRLLPQVHCPEPATGLPASIPPQSNRGPAPPSEHQDGVTDLSWHRRYPDYLGSAVHKLERAARSADRDDPASAQIRSDLAAAYYVRAQEQQDPRDLLRALEQLEQALALDPQLVPAWFNRSLTLTALALRHQARASWQRYLELDPASPWADEARSYLDSLIDPPSTAWDRQAAYEAIDRGDVEQLRLLADANRGAARENVETTLLGAWAEAAAAGNDAEAALQLHRARVLAELVAELNGDRQVLETVEVVEQATPAQRQSLIAGHREYQQGFDLLYRATAPWQACPALATAQTHLAAAQSPAAWRARLDHDLCRYFFGDPQDLSGMVQALETLVWELGERPYLGLMTRLYYLQGLCYERQGRWAEAQEHTYRAMQAARALGEISLLRSAETELGAIQDQLGHSDEAWRARFLSLVDLDRLDTTRQHEILLEVAFGLHKLELPAAALCVLDEAVSRLDPQSKVSLKVQPRIRRAWGLAHLGRTPAAQADLDTAAALLPHIDPALQAAFAADIGSAHAQLLAAQNPVAAVAQLDEVIPTYTATNKLLELPSRLLRAEVLADLGRSEEALADLNHALASYEDQRAQLEQDPWARLRFFEQARTAFEALIRLQVERGDVAAALDATERLRARVLLERAFLSTAPARARGASPRPLTWPEIHRRLPPSAVVISTLVLPDQLLLWRLVQGELELVTVPVPRDRLRALAEDLVSSLRWGRSDAAASAQELYRLLIAPLAADLAPGAPLILVPDLMLHEIPFAALLDEAGAPLVARHPTAVVPSLAVLLAVLDRDRELAKIGYTTALVVGNPPSELPDLPYAEAEAAAIAGLYPSARLRVGADATRAAFLSDLATGPAVVHVASHGLADLEAPLSSALFFTPEGDGEDGGRLLARDLYQLRLPATRLVVLAACESAKGLLTASEGPLHLARPFLAAGVPAVVASLWQVEDDSTKELLVRFHEELQRGNDPLRALQTAQWVEARRHGGNLRGARTWAAFQLIGGALGTQEESPWK